MTSVVAVNSNQQQQSYGQSGMYGQPMQQYYPAPANMASQQSSNTNVVVTNQPSPAPTQVSLPTEKPNPATFIVTIILMSVCTFFGMVHLLLCFIPALILSIVGFNYGYSKSDELKRQSRVFMYVAAGLDIAAMVFFAVSLVIIAIVASAVPANYALTYYNSYYYN